MYTLCSHTNCFASADVCECDVTGSVSVECAVGGQCECKPGVGGLQCNQCLPGFNDFGAEGCRYVTLRRHKLTSLN